MSHRLFVTTHHGPRTLHCRSGGGPGVALAETRLRCALPPTADHPVFRAFLSRQIRQDAWRAMRKVRGLSPTVTVVADPREKNQYYVTVGTQSAPARLPILHVRQVLEQLLSDAQCRRRWLDCAKRRACC